MKRANKILDLPNPAEVNYKLNALSLQAGYRDQTAIEKIIVDQIYKYPKEKVVLAASSNLESIYLIYINKIENVKIEKNSDEYKKYFILDFLIIFHILF